jgi:dTDP-4-dehydrorhamnose reductase
VAVLLVTGASGMLGRAVVAAAARAGHEAVAPARAELDVTDPEQVARALADARPAAVVNCAAWTDVDGAEEHEARATAVNGEGAGNVARAAAACGARVVHVSTDYVFAGDAERPYVEGDPVAPRSAYGRSKLAGEVAVAEATADHAIVRTAWLFGAGGRNFVDTMLELGRQREEVAVVDDQVGCPTWTGHLAPALVELAGGSDTGAFHVAGQGRCSWYELALEAFARAGVACRVRPTTSDAFPRPARRPAFSALASERPEAPTLPPWREGLAAHLRERAKVVVT